jgi:hypothetical protein
MDDSLTVTFLAQNHMQNHQKRTITQNADRFHGSSPPFEKKSFSKERVRDNCATTSFLQDIRSKLTKFQFGNDFATSLFLSLHNYTNNGEQLTGLMKLQNARIAIEFLSKKNYRCLLPFCFSENVPESRGDPLQQHQLLLLGREQRDQRLHG